MMEDLLKELMDGVADPAALYFCSIEGEGDDGDGGGGGGDASDDGSDDGDQGDGDGDDDGDADPKSKLRGKGLFSDDDGDGSDDDEGDGDGDGDDGDGDQGDKTPKSLEKFTNDEGEIDAEKLGKAYTELEAKFGKLRREKGLGDDVPESADDYFKDVDLKVDGVDRLGVEGPDDPGLKSWGRISHKYGIGKEAAIGIYKEMMKELNPLAPEPIDRDQEIEKLGKNGKNVVDGVFTWLEGHERDGLWNGDEIEMIGQLSSTATGIGILNKMRGLTGAEPIPVAASEGRSMSAQDWHQQYDAAMAKKDYAAQQKLEKLADELWPDGMPRRQLPG